MVSKKQLIEWVRERIKDDKTPSSQLIDYQLFVNLSNKSNDLTTAENRQFKKLLLELEQSYANEAELEPPTDADTFIASAKEMQILLSVSRETLSQYVKAGMPKVSRGVYNVKLSMDWWLENVYTGKTEKDDEDMTEAKRRYWSSKADEAELKVKLRKGELMPVSDHDLIKTAMCSDLRNTMLSWPARIAPNDDDLRKMLRHEVFSLLESFVRAGNFAPDRRRVAKKKVIAKKKK